MHRVGRGGPSSRSTRSTLLIRSGRPLGVGIGGSDAWKRRLAGFWFGISPEIRYHQS